MHIKMLSISATMMGEVNTIHPTLVWDEENAILIDTGYPGQLSLLRAAMEEAGVPFEKLTRVVITHQDLDHIGSLPTILQEAAQPIEVLASPIEIPYMDGTKRPLKLTDEAVAQAEASLPPEVPAEWKQAFLSLLKNPPTAPVDTAIAHGAALPCGLTVIDTPGHTPGHLSLYHAPSKTLIAADALVVEAGQLNGPSPLFTLDMETAIRSLQQFLPFDIDTVICYHGGAYTEQAKQRLAELAGV
ncbi:glyoxylase-like metal-dependent hydrolase (beta-lactamase superfamily II) [Tumebacillus sp. BK434]|uniref:MBL fold metallo-hydrolase n=1 Tax=Tumebacillus sp. BK434 TaxID=2512169 RepID=UPI0010E45594|nr:MBL fold metallo-hydrolase [Tumebacillus sp. BK434]TCP52625.1 glyoxylase-like metal-dependent hydrolase (beta-lactamase superfamily II) [Tumebacillus sp. BK434]